ncbi:MAG: MBL fold metallo-hydrolase [Acutalibacteraceae bacterium]|nr:MBL fold metallo-hydrolase [Acutalibacteraceae bacterium]
MIKVKTTIAGALMVNCYIIEDVETGDIAIVDPGYTSTEIKKLLDEKSDKIKYILLTHGHFDHIGYVKKLTGLTNAKVVISKLEEPFLLDTRLNLLPPSFGKFISDIIADITLEDNDELMLGKTVIKYISTPGHTQGSGCFIIDNCIFTGDTIMKLSMGRTDLPTGNDDDMVKSLKRLYNLDENYTVYPGHGDSSTLEYEKKYNPYLKINK